MVYSGKSMFTSVLESKAIFLQCRALMAKLSYWYNEGAAYNTLSYLWGCVEGTLLGHLKWPMAYRKISLKCWQTS